MIESYGEDDFIAIDSNHIEDREGNHWLSLGSFWSGLSFSGGVLRATLKPLSWNVMVTSVA